MEKEYYCLFHDGVPDFNTISEDQKIFSKKVLHWYHPWSLKEVLNGIEGEFGKIFYDNETECNFEVKKIQIKVIEDEPHRKKLGNQEEV